jgi:hypothetical protein
LELGPVVLPLWPAALLCPMGVNAPHPAIRDAAAMVAAILLAQRGVTGQYRRVAG